MHRGEQLWIRADGDARMGMGHVMRTLALAQAWQDEGGAAAYFQAATTPVIEQRLRAERVEVVSQNVEPGSGADADALIRTAAAERAPWVVLDGYHFDDRYQRRVKEAGFRLLLVDDLGQSGHYCADLVLNQDLNAAAALYVDREPYTKLLLGTDYVLLRREFRSYPPQPRDFSDRPQTLLVTMGGADPNNVTLQVVEALVRSGRKELQVLVVIGPSNRHGASLEAAAKECSSIRLLRSPPDMPRLMAQCGAAITAGGSTVWELAYFAVPSVVLVIAENQRPCAEQLRAREACLVLDDVEGRPQLLAEAIDRLLEDPQQRALCSARFSALVDGRGAERVCAAMRGAA
jgi:UDP-2,4-diacetamido-2,4,6-trideoxy-beta-L-altropyranose hydrolase